MAYVYEHWRPDTNLCFWVGKGSDGRAYLTKRRNRRYTAIVEKLAAAGLAVDVRITADGLSDEEAFALEIERIDFWKRAGVTLANHSIGGRGGHSGFKRSAEARAKQSATATGRKLSPSHHEKIVVRMRSPEWKARNSAVHTGRKRPPETSAKIGAAQKRSWADPTIRERRIAAIKAGKRPVSEETRAKMRAAKTPEARARISAAAKKQWENPEFRRLVSETMTRTNAKIRKAKI